jgi:hypothetical protein
MNVGLVVKPKDLDGFWEVVEDLSNLILMYVGPFFPGWALLLWHLSHDLEYPHILSSHIAEYTDIAFG